MDVLPGVGVIATVGGRVWVGAVTVAVPVARTISGVTVGNCGEVGVAAGSDGRAIGPQWNGSSNSSQGANRAFIPGGTNSGLKRTKTTVARESSRINPSKSDSNRRFFRFLRLGLKTGNSPAEETPVGFPCL